LEKNKYLKISILSKYFFDYYFLLALIPFYHSILYAPFNLHPKLIYAITFVIYIVFIFINKNNILNINKWLFFSSIFIVPSMLLGLYMEWHLVDILADVSRYLAPFIGFAVGVALLSRINYTRIVYLLYGIGIIELISYYNSLVNKVVYVLQGGPVVEYASAHGLQINTWHFFLFFFVLRNKLVSGWGKFLLIGYVIGYIINPILLMSKARTITVGLSFILIFFFYSKAKEKIRIAFFLLLLGFISSFYIVSDDFSRFGDVLELIETGEYGADASTSVRVAEIINITETLYENLPYSLFLGMGSGALYYDDYSELKGGISQENYREDGGIHHIFTVYFMYIFRYGFIGLMLMLLFIYHVQSEMRESKTNMLQDTITSSVKLFIVISLVEDVFVPSYVYGNFLFGFIMSIGLICHRKYFILNKDKSECGL
jgi:hypothetical protein